MRPPRRTTRYPCHTPLTSSYAQRTHRCSCAPWRPGRSGAHGVAKRHMAAPWAASCAVPQHVGADLNAWAGRTTPARAMLIAARHSFDDDLAERGSGGEARRLHVALRCVVCDGVRCPGCARRFQSFTASARSSRSRSTLGAALRPSDPCLPRAVPPVPLDRRRCARLGRPVTLRGALCSLRAPDRWQPASRCTPQHCAAPPSTRSAR
jgi:hypothetical protein